MVGLYLVLSEFHYVFEELIKYPDVYRVCDFTVDLSSDAVPKVHVPKSGVSKEHYQAYCKIHVFIKGEILHVEARVGDKVCGKGTIKFC